MTLGSHQQTVGKSQQHFTPHWLVEAVGPFDLDPCAGSPRPWDCAERNIALPYNGLESMWSGMVWLNPPFDRYQVGKWIARMAYHDNGIALLHARTETAWFQPVWQHASALLFLARRLSFCLEDGSAHPANSGAPPVLVAFGQRAADRLTDCDVAGTLVKKWTIK
jgi:hypothetical protein